MMAQKFIYFKNAHTLEELEHLKKHFMKMYHPDLTTENKEEHEIITKDILDEYDRAKLHIHELSKMFTSKPEVVIAAKEMSALIKKYGLTDNITRQIEVKIIKKLTFIAPAYQALAVQFIKTQLMLHTDKLPVILQNLEFLFRKWTSKKIGA